MKTVIGVIAVLTAAATADAPYEHWWVSRSAIADGVLTGAVAVVNLPWGFPAYSLSTFTRSDSAFTAASAADPGDWTPLSSFGYHSDRPLRLRDGVYRFPVVEIADTLICVVTDPPTAATTWIRRPPDSGSWSFGLVRFDSLAGCRGWLDPFTLSGFGAVTVYEDADGSRHRLIPKDELPGPLRAVEQRGNYVRVIAVIDRGDWTEERPLGWLRVRDSRGRLLLWLYDFGNC
jgi:hypothetical protein